ncbi:MAG: lipopolysaccharide assembly protein LapA domain-containing protein [Solirubrobacterales bacterium]
MTEIPSASAGGSRWRLYVAIAAVVLAAIFILQNSDETEVKFFFSTTTTPLIFALLLAFALGLIIGLVLPRFRHRD